MTSHLALTIIAVMLVVLVAVIIAALAVGVLLVKRLVSLEKKLTNDINHFKTRINTAATDTKVATQQVVTVINKVTPAIKYVRWAVGGATYWLDQRAKRRKHTLLSRPQLNQSQGK